MCTRDTSDDASRLCGYSITLTALSQTFERENMLDKEYGPGEVGTADPQQ